MKRFVMIAVAALALLVSASPVSAGGGQAAGGLSALPADIDLCVELTGLEPGEWSFLTSIAEPWAPLDASWRALAQELELGDGAFGKLLGTRVTVAARGLWEEELSPAWAVLLETDEATSARLRKALKATPRRIVGGRVTLTLEGGRFQITELDHGAGAAVTVMLAPTGEKGAIFREACSGEGGAFSATELARALRGLGSAHRASLTLPEEKGWLTLGAPALGERVEVTMRGRVEQTCGEGPGFRPEVWAKAGEGAVFWSAERMGDLNESGEALPAPLAMVRPVIDAMGPESARVAAIVLRAREGETGVIDLGAAVEARGARARAAEIDRAMAALVAPATGVETERLDFLGLYPASRRDLPVGEGGRVFWRYLGDAGEPGWVTASTEEELERAMARAAASERGQWRAELAAGGEEDGAHWKTVGRAEPARLVRAIGEGAPEPLRRLAGIASIEWAVKDRPGGRVEGTFTITRAE